MNSELRRFIAEHPVAVSALSFVEVLGYYQLTEQDRLYFEEFFRVAQVLPISQPVLDQAVVLRQQRRMDSWRCRHCGNSSCVRPDAYNKEHRRFPMDRPTPAT